MNDRYLISLNKAALYIEKVLKFLDVECKVKSIENSDNEILKMMDNFSGIDWIGLDKDLNVFGVAVRIQFIKNGKKPFDSFTIRYHRHTGTRTEFSKRLTAIKNNLFFPTYTMQCFVDEEKGELLSAAVIKTIDLYKFCEVHKYKIKKNCSDNEFLIVYWDDIKLADYEIKIIKL